jgi:hypothetical protein
VVVVVVLVVDNTIAGREKHYIHRDRVGLVDTVLVSMAFIGGMLMVVGIVVVVGMVEVVGMMLVAGIVVVAGIDWRKMGFVECISQWALGFDRHYPL